MSLKEFEVYPYDIAALNRILAEKSRAPEELVASKSHFYYFEKYCEDIGARTIIVENDYVDRDYLGDFAGYYVLCFEQYDRMCTRLHLFGISFGEKEFEGLLRGNGTSLTETQMQDAYLGFVIVKPLPQTIIGRTCLKTYDETIGGGRRKYPITREYEANLFGITLKVRSLAFQEQDHVVAACATSALWSAFHGTGKLFQHSIPSPVEITRAATAHLPLETRAFPSDGLTSEQMAHAIRNVGLEPFLVRAQHEHVLKSTVYAYLRGMVPILMGIKLVDTSTAPDPVLLGKHAVAVTGYSLGSPTTGTSLQETRFSLSASRMDKIYVHDDQVGPFARMEICYDSNAQIKSFLSTSWKGRDGKIGSVVAIPDILLIPVYHKIRIPFDVVHDTVLSFNDNVIEVLRGAEILTLSECLEWDIYLTTVNSLKTDILRSARPAGNKRYASLLKNLPRFLWRATGICENEPVIDLIFDATDIEQSPFLVYAIEYDTTLFSLLREISRMPQALSISKGDLEWKILEWFSRAQ
ncbi:MAG: hypothetical protein AB2L11_13625 [Syntrophobacteraceae bacterium]